MTAHTSGNCALFVLGAVVPLDSQQPHSRPRHLQIRFMRDLPVLSHVGIQYRHPQAVVGNWRRTWVFPTGRQLSSRLPGSPRSCVGGGLQVSAGQLRFCAHESHESMQGAPLPLCKAVTHFLQSLPLLTGFDLFAQGNSDYLTSRALLSYRCE